MDFLEEQLEQLQLSVNQLSGSPVRKVGPAVPPKPSKTSKPLVPKSCQIKQYSEPSYSTILQPNNYDANAAATAAAAARRHLNNTYSNVPAVKTIIYDKIKDSNDPNNEFIPGRIYENQKISINNVIKPMSEFPPPPPPQTTSNNLDYHIYSNASDKKPEIPQTQPKSHYGNINFEHTQNYRQALPPAPLNVQIMSNYHENDEEFPPPPSPVSSSYSELRRATTNDRFQPQQYQQQQHQQPQHGTFTHQPIQNAVEHENINSQFNVNYNPSDYLTYGGISSQSSSTYESIYEPINPRPPSQMSNRSNYSLYTPYMSDNSQAGGGGGNRKIQNIKEVEVDALTDMLVNSMDNIQDGDTYGICVKCNDRIVGENTGCTAMDLNYHITCFTCYQCQINLQGKQLFNKNKIKICSYVITNYIRILIV